MVSTTPALMIVRRRRPNPEPVGGGQRRLTPGGSVHRLHLATCRHAQGAGATPITYDAWQFEHARCDDDHNDYELCKVCRPEEGDG